jgi:hypothetical protein
VDERKGQERAENGHKAMKINELRMQENSKKGAK